MKTVYDIIKESNKCIVCGGKRSTKGFCMKCYTHLYRHKILENKTMEQWHDEYKKNMNYTFKGELVFRGVKELDTYQVKKHIRSTKYTNFKEGYFNRPLSDNAKYFIGLLATDGCVYSNRVELTLKDSDIIYLFTEELGLPKECVEIKNIDKSVVYRLRFSSSSIVKTLSDLGIVERKSATLSVSDDLYLSSDFIRGVIDGDGSICIGKNGTPTVVIYSGSKEFLIKVSRYFDTLKAQYVIHPINNLYGLYIKGDKKEKARVLMQIYNKPPHILRKYKKVEEIIGK